MMTPRTFVAWVEQPAEQLRKSRAEIARTARQLPPEHWLLPSPLPGWTYQDLLAHLAGDTGKISSATFRAAVTGQSALDCTFLDGGDAWNARDVQERRDLSVEELIAEIEADGAAWQDLLSQVKETDQDRRWSGFPMSLSDYLRLLMWHEDEHLKHLRTALEAKT